jgi:hypothetical protein
MGDGHSASVGVRAITRRRRQLRLRGARDALMTVVNALIVRISSLRGHLRRTDWRMTTG